MKMEGEFIHIYSFFSVLLAERSSTIVIELTYSLCILNDALSWFADNT